MVLALHVGAGDATLALALKVIRRRARLGWVAFGGNPPRPRDGGQRRTSAVAEEPAVAAACVIYVIDDGEPEMVRKLGDGGDELRKVATAEKSKARADQLLAELGLEERADNLPRQLSGGERQRVAVGRAFMNQPDLVLIDEPTSALDTKLGEQVMELIVTEVRARDTPAVIVTHDMRMTHYADITLNIVDGILGDAATS